jgi:hypothetical protein
LAELVFKRAVGAAGQAGEDGVAGRQQDIRAGHGTQGQKATGEYR